MREKNLIILCIIFAVLVSLIFFKKSMKPKVPTTEQIVNIIKQPVSIDNVNEIMLRLGNGEEDDKEKPKNLHLVKQDDHWITKTQYGAYASDNVIKPVLEKLDQLEGELRSDDGTLFADYEISGNEALHIILARQESDPVHLVVGLKKTGNQNNFVRFGEFNAVYVVNDNLLSAFGVRGEDDDIKLDVQKWTDRHILQLDVNEVVGLSITQEYEGKSQQVIDLKKETVDDKQQWQSSIAYDFGLSATNIKRVVETFKNTYAREFIAPDVEDAFDEVGWTGVFTMADGSEVKLVRGKETSGSNYYGKVEGAGYYYLIPTQTFHSRQDQQGNIFSKNPLKADEKTADEIHIQSLNTKNEFHAVKQPPKETDDATDDKPQEDTWATPGGESVEKSKLSDIVNKLKAFKLETVLLPSVSLKEDMTITITKNGTSSDYSVSEDVILETGKECRILKIKGKTRGYCVPKSSVTALQNALP